MRRSVKTLGVVAAIAVVLTGCVPGTTTDTSAPSGSSSFENDGCIHISIATSSEKVNLMDELAEKFKSSPEASAVGQCVSVKPINLSSGAGADLFATKPTEYPLADQEYWPTLWSPASTIWTNRVEAGNAQGTVVDAQSFTHTPVVIGMPESLAKALDYPNKPVSLTDLNNLITNGGWASVGKPIWGDFKMSKTNPDTSTTGMEIIIMQDYENANKQADLTVEDVDAAADFNRVFESAAIHYGDTTGKVLTTLYNESLVGASSGGYISAIPLEETSLINYNMGNPDSHTVAPGEVLTPPKEKLVAIYPSNGSMWSDNPVTVLNVPWVTAEKAKAGAAFAKFLQTNAAQQVLPKYGFRPLDETVPLGDLFTKANGIDPDQPAIELPQPSPVVVSAAKDQWTKIRKASAVLEVIDMSGSMDDGTGDGRTKLEGALDGVIDTVSHFRSTDEVGVWRFTTGISSEYGDSVVAVREFGPLANGTDSLQNDVQDLKFASADQRGGTPLYDAILAAYEYMQTKAEPGRINAIVVLTDGDDRDSNTSLDSLLIKINSDKGENSKGAQIRIFPIAYGADANIDILGQIAKASGGQVFDARDATKIDTVFKSVINNF